MYFSAETNGFYDPLISVIPSDAVEISAELYDELLKGQSAGKVIKAGDDGLPFLGDAPQQPVFVPVITRRQARLKLLDLGLLEAVEGMVYGSENKALAIEYETDKFERGSPLFTNIGAAFNLDDAAIDNLFIEAADL